MANKTVSKNADKKENKLTANPGKNQNVADDTATDKKQKNSAKKSSGFIPDAVGRSAVSQVKANSSRDVRGSNGLGNTGTIISYE